MSLTRAASVSGFDPLVRDLGGDPVVFARQVGLPVEALAQPELLVPIEACGELLEVASAELGCPDLGLRIAEHQQLDGLGPLALAVRHSGTMRDAFEVARRFLALHSRGSTLELVPDPFGDDRVVGIRHVWLLDARVFPQAADKALVNLHRVVEALAGGSYGLRSVEVAHASPAPDAAYGAAFGVPVRRGREVTALRAPISLLDQDIAGADEGLRAVALDYLARQGDPADLRTTTRVRAAVEALMGTGRLSASTVAAAVETSERTLQRRLADEGTSTQQVIDLARRDRARRLLADAALSVADVAAMLDFDSQATLSRAARRWWSKTPTEMRRSR